jgi:hypothetical protein
MMLFHLFWLDRVLKKIVDETNYYARTKDTDGRRLGVRNWRNLSVQGLKAFFALSIYMGLKK